MVTWIENSEKWVIAVSYMVALYSRTLILDTWQKLYHCHSINVTAYRDHTIWKVILKHLKIWIKHRRKGYKIAFSHLGSVSLGEAKEENAASSADVVQTAPSLLAHWRLHHGLKPQLHWQELKQALQMWVIFTQLAADLLQPCGALSWVITAFRVSHVKCAMPTAYFSFHMISISH